LINKKKKNLNITLYFKYVFINGGLVVIKYYLNCLKIITTAF